MYLMNIYITEFVIVQNDGNFRSFPRYKYKFPAPIN